MAVGRTTEARTVAGVGTTATSTAITGPAGSFLKGDAGRPISGTGIPAGATLAAVASGTAATLSAAATATGTITATIGTATGTATGAAALGYGFLGWSPETDTESGTYTLAAVNAGQVPPDRITNTYTGVSTLQRGRG